MYGVSLPPCVNPIYPLYVLVSPYLAESFGKVFSFLRDGPSAHDGISYHRLVLICAVYHKNTDLVAHCLLPVYLNYRLRLARNGALVCLVGWGEKGKLPVSYGWFGAVKLRSRLP